MTCINGDVFLYVFPIHVLGCILMDKLPVEILIKIIDLLNPREQVQLQLVSRRFFTLARNNKLWRLHCYAKSWSGLHSSSPSFWSRIAQSASSTSEGTQGRTAPHPKPNEPSKGERSRAAAEWDPSYDTEDIDWYSEYIARHAPISFSWLRPPRLSSTEALKTTSSRDVKGIGLFRDWSSARDDKVVAPLEDGTVCIWDFNNSYSKLSSLKKGHVAGTSAPGILFTPLSGRGEKSVEFLNVGECVSIDSNRRRVYIAVGSALNEVDLETVKVISQQRYAWSIFALSQETDYSTPLTLATTLSLEIYDSRLSTPAEEPDISFQCAREPLAPRSSSDLLHHSDNPITQRRLNSLPRYRIRSPGRSEKRANYASLFQPGPLSILHPPMPHINTILLAGRFPSILCYDRRFFPQLQNAVHSGGGLCGLASIPIPRFSSESQWPSKHTIAACGEYNGKGSLELYDLSLAGSNPEDGYSQASSTMSVVQQNRQSAAASKLLSVASHGSRVVFSDSNGYIKWVERDGRADVRRWNINIDGKARKKAHGSSIRADHPPRHSSVFGSSSPLNGDGHGSNHGNDVARKILPTDTNLAGDELLLWTGDRIGRLYFSHANHGSELDDDEEGDDLDVDHDVDGDILMDDEARQRYRERRREEQRRQHEYAGTIRRALEIQADGVRWMGRLGMH